MSITRRILLQVGLGAALVSAATLLASIYQADEWAGMLGDDTAAGWPWKAKPGSA